MKRGVVERTFLRFRDDITFGKFKPGEHLSESTLTNEYGISRPSLREVIKQLASQGYLTVEPNRGAIVTKLTLSDIDVIYNILVRCESYAAALFTARRDAAGIKRLEQAHKKMQIEDVRVKYRAWLGLNDKFHEIIYSNCGSSILAELIHNIRFRIYRFRTWSTSRGIIDSLNDEHDKILRTIRERDVGLAEELMKTHLEAARKRRLERFSEFRELL